jgi:hypothetical protein
MTVRIYAIVGGSLLQGPMQELSELPYGEFKIIMLENSLVKACEKNIFINNYEGSNERYSDHHTYTYQTARTGEDVESMNIKAFEIKQIIKDCIKTTVAEWCKPCFNETYCYEWDGCYGTWETVKLNEFVTEISLD